MLRGRKFTGGIRRWLALVVSLVRTRAKPTAGKKIHCLGTHSEMYPPMTADKNSSFKTRRQRQSAQYAVESDILTSTPRAETIGKFRGQGEHGLVGPIKDQDLQI